ncbi:hypothetical protein CC78DRAFT_615211 [Lojkania enalia]|uniref:Ubiquitin-like-conjugating enzyme ATG10 n=1 Tax=Lojkania enalia TaxID=147567 RepID=A0A9P4KDZ8_9PLEO|nr:hypothetical protein CC78DRAFT_615211 [Didymosphaeria enalia]
MEKVTAFPFISKAEFEKGCEEISVSFANCSKSQSGLLSMEAVLQDGSMYLKIVKALQNETPKPPTAQQTPEEQEIGEDDDEALLDHPSEQVAVQYDIIYSTSYQVPVIYFRVKDPAYRFPPTMEILYQYIIPRQFKQQTDNTGVIGGITVADHPFTNSPAFFIHPCRTAKVLETSLETKDIGPKEYLILWMTAFGNYIQLGMPAYLAQTGTKLGL